MLLQFLQSDGDPCSILSFDTGHFLIPIFKHLFDCSRIVSLSPFLGAGGYTQRFKKPHYAHALLWLPKLDLPPVVPARTWLIQPIKP